MAWYCRSPSTRGNRASWFAMARKKARGGGEFQPHARERFGIRAAPVDDVLRRAAAMVAEAEEAHRVVHAGRQFAHAFLDPLLLHRLLLTLGIVIAVRDAEGGDDRPARLAAPAKEPRGQFLFVLLRTHHDVVRLAELAHDARQDGGVAERVDVVADRRKLPEARAKIIAPELDLFPESVGAGQVAVGLDPPAAHDLPAAGAHVRVDALEERRVDALDLVVGPRLAAREDDIRVPVEQVAHRLAGVEHRVEARGPWPEPDRVDVRVENEMDRFHGRDRMRENLN